MSKFYMMSAGCLVDNKAVTVATAHHEWEGSDGTIIVGKRQRGYETFSKIFLHGCGCGCGNYGVKAGDKVRYTQDTGNGYKCVDYDFEVENVIQITADGDITSENDIGLNEKRRLWVMK